MKKYFKHLNGKIYTCWRKNQKWSTNLTYEFPEYSICMEDNFIIIQPPNQEPAITLKVFDDLDYFRTKFFIDDIGIVHSVWFEYGTEGTILNRTTYECLEFEIIKNRFGANDGILLKGDINHIQEEFVVFNDLNDLRDCFNDGI